MSTAFTSRLAYKSIQDGLGGLQREVWLAIRDWEDLRGPSIDDLAEKTGRRVSSICGRVNELRAAGAIEDAGMKPGRCGKLVKTYTARVWRAPVDERLQLRFPL